MVSKRHGVNRVTCPLHFILFSVHFAFHFHLLNKKNWDMNYYLASVRVSGFRSPFIAKLLCHN